MSNRTFIVTGSASGIGRAAATRLTRDEIARGGKPQFVLVDIAAAQLEKVADEIASLGAQVEIFVGDLSDSQVPEAIVARAADRFGGLDVLVSNAGVVSRANMLALTLEEYDLTFAVNTRATWLLAKFAYPLLKLTKGCIIATASISAYEPSPMIGAYAPSKAALLMFIRQMAVAWGPDGIRSNSVSPGSTATSLGGEPGSVSIREDAVGNNPLGFIARPDDQAAAIAFLASPDARFINGADIVVDGGARTQLMAKSGMGDPNVYKKPA